MKKFKVSSSEAVLSTSSNGNLMKWEVVENNKTIFIKTSSIDRQSLALKWMYEAYSEVICSRLFKELGVENVVQYYLCEIIIDNNIKTIGCYSYSFLKDNEQLVTLAHLNKIGKLANYATLGYDGYERCIRDVTKLTGIDYKTELDKILTLDFIVLNQDRHLGNIGLIYNRASKKIKSQYIFDNGDSLFATKYIDDMQYVSGLDSYLRAKPFNISHLEQLKYTKLDGLKHMNLDISNTLKFIDTLEDKGLPKGRIKFIKSLLMTRINYLKSLKL